MQAEHHQQKRTIDRKVALVATLRLVDWSLPASPKLNSLKTVARWDELVVDSKRRKFGKGSVVL